MQSLIKVSGYVAVDGYIKTSFPGVYAIGNMIPSPQFTHVAVAWGKAAVEILVGQAPSANLSVISRCVYTIPEIAEVGLRKMKPQVENLRQNWEGIDGSERQDSDPSGGAWIHEDYN